MDVFANRKSAVSTGFEIFDNDFGGKSAFSKGLGVVFNDEKASKKRMNQK